VVDTPVPGLASIAGGKFTTYRLMARDVVDAAVADFDREVPGSVTEQVPLLGADGLAAVQPAVGRLAEDYGVPRAAVEHLLGRYGTLAAEVLELVKGDAALGRPLAQGHPYLRAEVAYAVSHEGALHVEDVLMRRTRLFIESADSGAAVAAEVAALMGRSLGWSRRRRAAETRRYLDLVEAERALPAVDSVPAPGLALAAARMNQPSARRLLTFRLDQEQRQRLRARLAREGRTMSEVVTNGLRQYVETVLARGDGASPGGRPPGDPPGHGGLARPPYPRAPPTPRADGGAVARAALVRAQRAAVRDAGRAERGRLAAALAGRGPRHQPPGGAGPGPPPGQGRPARPRGAVRAAAAVPAATGGQPGRTAPAPDDQDRPHAARVGAPGRGR
jgi:hypothetical protein